MIHKSVALKSGQKWPQFCTKKPGDTNATPGRVALTVLDIEKRKMLVN